MTRVVVAVVAAVCLLLFVVAIVVVVVVAQKFYIKFVSFSYAAILKCFAGVYRICIELCYYRCTNILILRLRKILRSLSCLRITNYTQHLTHLFSSL